MNRLPSWNHKCCYTISQLCTQQAIRYFLQPIASDKCIHGFQKGHQNWLSMHEMSMQAILNGVLWNKLQVECLQTQTELSLTINTDYQAEECPSKRLTLLKPLLTLVCCSPGFNLHEWNGSGTPIYIFLIILMTTLVSTIIIYIMSAKIAVITALSKGTHHPACRELIASPNPCCVRTCCT